MRCGLAVLATVAACGRFQFEPRAETDPDAGLDGVPDAAVDADSDPAPSGCTPGAPFGAPVLIAELDAPGVLDGTLRLRPDELSGYFWSQRSGDSDIYFVSRTSLTAPFVVQAISGLNTTAYEVDPTIARDGSVMVFRRNMPGDDLWVAERVNDTTFTNATALTNLNTSVTEQQPFLADAYGELIFGSFRPGSAGLGDLYISDRTGTTFGAPARITALATTDDEGDPTVSADGNTLYFRSDRPATLGGYNIYVATRTAAGTGFGTPALVDGVNSEADEGPSAISDDDCRLYLSSDRDGMNAVYVATRGS